MATKNIQKLKLLYILELLLRETDENHKVGSEDILAYLAEKGIRAERKSVYNDISVLVDYGYDVIKDNGWFIGARDFEFAEIRLLSDAVQAANFITPKKTKQLLKKIFGLISSGQAEFIRKQVYVDKRPKCGNEELYYTIDKLSRAIQQKNMIRILYRKRVIGEDRRVDFEEREHELSPYSLIWSNDHYYLVGNKSSYDNLMVMRIDRMKSVEILEDRPSRPFSEVSPYENSFDAADYANKHFNMFSGEPEPIELLCKNETVEQILDKFGEKADICQFDDGRFMLRANAAVSEGLVFWLMQFGGSMQVKSPQSLRNRLLEKAGEIRRMYEP